MEIINLLSDKELEIIKLKLLYLLKYKINKYNNNLVSSISYNEAVNINNSNYYVIKLYLSNKTINEQRDILLNNDIIDIYNKSNDNIIRLFNKTKLFYNTIFKNNMINTKNYYYNSTLYEGIDVFFKKYNYSYDSTNYIITVDYNTYILRSNYLGIEFINDYLIKINYENIFCNKFNNIDNLLIKLYSNYIDLPINIFEIVLTKVIILEYLNKNIYKLDSNIEVNILYNDYKNIDNYILKLNKCYDKVINNLKLNKDTYNYLLLCKKDIINNIVFHTKNNTLDMIV